MMRAEIWLQDHLDSQQGIDDLANRLGYSSSQVRRRFKQCFGLSPSTYRDILRLEKAARLLALTPHSVATIAVQCGYRNHSAFSRAFQRHFAQSPRQFRQKQRKRLYDLRSGDDPPPFEIRQHAARQALVTRLYQTPRRIGDLTKLATQTHGDDILPARLRKAPAVAVVHGLPLPTTQERIDLGVLVAPQAATCIAIPPTFRLLKLPARQHACLVVEAFSEVPSAVEYLVSQGLPNNHRYASGDPVQVHWHPRGLEVQLPLLGDNQATK